MSFSSRFRLLTAVSPVFPVRARPSVMRHAPLVVSGVDEFAVDDLLEMPFVRVHGGRAEIGGVAVRGLMIFEPMGYLLGLRRVGHQCSGVVRLDRTGVLAGRARPVGVHRRRRDAGGLRDFAPYGEPLFGRRVAAAIERGDELVLDLYAVPYTNLTQPTI